MNKTIDLLNEISEDVVVLKHHYYELPELSYFDVEAQIIVGPAVINNGSLVEPHACSNGYPNIKGTFHPGCVAFSIDVNNPLFKAINKPFPARMTASEYGDFIQKGILPDNKTRKCIPCGWLESTVAHYAEMASNNSMAKTCYTVYQEFKNTIQKANDIISMTQGYHPSRVIQPYKDGNYEGLSCLLDNIVEFDPNALRWTSGFVAGQVKLDQSLLQKPKDFHKGIQ